MPLEFEYPCVAVRQQEGGKELLLFSASALDVERWVGIPQRLSFSGAETSGFQRTVSPTREAALRKFFSEERNVIQNPLLCAIRQAPGLQVAFRPDQPGSMLGTVKVSFEDYGALTLHQLLTAARVYLESRVPELAKRSMPVDLVVNLEASIDARDLEARDVHLDPDLDANGGESEDGEGDEPAEEALFDESQITDFWDQLRAREEVVGKLNEAAGWQAIAGFSREMLQSYLQPIILVDGQHRLRGAVLAAKDDAEVSKAASDLVLDGTNPEDARAAVLKSTARQLPISLLMDDSPAEHVFQFVLVNQKATPVPKALLGTIISTSLAAEELETIAHRLEDAKIELEGSRIVSILSRSEDSPFRGLVAKGFGFEDGGKLQWSVLGSLSDMFRYLKGARFYHDTATDHAATWRKHHLDASGIVGDWQAREFSDPYAYWQDLSGPWLDVFKEFWTRTRDHLASTENPFAHNHWGNTLKSNIFNKPTLHVLATDFFSYLREQKVRLTSKDDIESVVNGWLEYVSPQYFSRDWKLEGSGVKKDSVGTRRQWSKLWADHRQQGGSPPAPAEYIKLKKV